MNYCLGFLIDPSGKSVLLIKKSGPHWQEGKFNGVGGKLEQGESSLQAMIRECQEETGLEVRQWETLGNLAFPGGGVDVYYASCDLTLARQTTDEELAVVNLAEAVMEHYPLVDEVGVMLTRLWSLLEKK